MVRLTTEEVNAFITKLANLEHFSMYVHSNLYPFSYWTPYSKNVADLMKLNLLLQTFNVNKVRLIALSVCGVVVLREGFKLTSNPNL
jgi:hypothetical protein